MEKFLFQQLLTTSVLLSTISCAFIQKTKGLFRNNKIIIIYSFIVNLLLGVIFCYSFTDLIFPKCIWVGIFSFIGADSIYKSLEGRLSRHSEIRNRKKKQ